MTAMAATIAPGATILEAYREERAQLLRGRVDAVAGFFLATTGAAAVFDRLSVPDRGHAILHVYPIQMGLCVLAVLACRWRPLRDAAPVLVSALSALLVALMDWYLVTVGAPLEQLALNQVCVIAGTVVLLPWGWRAQLLFSISVVAMFLGLAPSIPATSSRFYAGLSVVVVAVAGVWSVITLERYRRDAFVHGAVKTEEAEISSAIMHVGESLHAHLQQPDLLDLLTRLAAELLGCDWSGVYLWDDRKQRHCLHALAGAPSEEDRAAMMQLEFAPGSLPLLEAFSPGELLELQASDAGGLVPPELLARFRVTSALYAPIFRDRTLIGVIVHGYSSREQPFSSKQRRLARGIAHAAAIALENARLVADLQTASRLKSEFVATMSHELRTPINVLAGYSEMLGEGTFGLLNPEQLDAVRRVDRSARELLELITATLDLGRIEAGREWIERAPVDMHELLAGLEREVEPLIAPEVTLRWFCERDLVIVSDRGKLKTILKNLIGNALKFTAEGEVEVRLTWHAGRMLAVVRDTGAGIATEHLPVIFEMFRQVDASATRQFGGVGLGLHIVKRLVSVLGGEITVESALGVGSVFTVSVPAERQVRPVSKAV